MYGFIAFIAWGAVYGLLPRLTGREPSPLAVGVHFWLALVGVVTYVIAISVAGVLQGFAWVGGQSFIASVIAAEPMWLWRTIGGLLMVSSHVVFAVNVWAMRPQRADGTRRRGGRGQEPSVNFGGLHTSHRAIVAVAAIVFFVLTLVMAVLPALREQAFPALAGIKPRGHEEERGRQVYMREGCGFCHTQFVRDLPMDRPYGRPSRPGRLRARESSDARHPAHGARSRRRGRAAAERGLAHDPPLRSARGRAAVGDAGLSLVLRGEGPGRTGRRRRAGARGPGAEGEGHRRGSGRDRAGPLPAVAQAGEGVAVMMDHAAGASHASPVEWLLVLAAAIVLVWSLALAIRYTVRPRETEAAHIKRRILDEIDEPEEASRR